MVDLEVVAALHERGKFGETYNDVIREALGLRRLDARVGGSWVVRPRSLGDIVAVGLLRPDQIVTWHRSRLERTYTATVTADGRLRTGDGETYATPDTCATAVAGYPAKGWPNWRTEDGISLQELRDLLTPESVEDN
jgi:hypothetical protein